MNVIRIIRWVGLTAVLLAATMLPSGCSSASNLAGKLPGPLGKNARDDSLRERVESDEFPTASQAGL